MTKMLKILIGIGGVAVVGGGAAGAAIVLTKKHTDENAGGNGGHGPQIPGTHNPVVGPQSNSHHEILVSDMADFNHKISGHINAGDIYKFPGSKNTFTGKQLNKLNENKLRAPQPNSFIRDLKSFKNHAYYYYDNSSINSDAPATRIKSFKNFLLTEHQIIVPVGVTINSVSKPDNSGVIHTHNITVNFSGTSIKTQNIKFDYNHEDSAQSAFLKNHFGWFKGAIVNFALDHTGTKSFIEKILSKFNVSPKFAHFIGEFMKVKMIAGVLATAVSTVLAPAGMALILPIVPLYIISYFIKKGVDSKLHNFKKSIVDQLADYQS